MGGLYLPPPPAWLLPAQPAIASTLDRLLLMLQGGLQACGGGDDAQGGAAAAGRGPAEPRRRAAALPTARLRRCPRLAAAVGRPSQSIREATLLSATCLGFEPIVKPVVSVGAVEWGGTS